MEPLKVNEKEEHLFAQYVRILARGKTKTRPFTEEEAQNAMDMIMAGDVRAEQLGAFLMLLRFKEETAEEIAGFVRSVRASLKLSNITVKVDLDWSSYAGKRRQLPWFLLSALILSHNGTRIFMHGTEGHTTGRIYTRSAIEAIGMPIAKSLKDAATKIDKNNFAYLPLENISPRLKEIIELKSVLGLRSPVHTIARLINPFNAPFLLQGIFHRGFMQTHQRAAQLLNQPHMAVFRGDGGEIECRPNKPTEVLTVHKGKINAFIWPPILDESRQPIDENIDINRIKDVWVGKDKDEYAIAAIVGTTAIALETLGETQGHRESFNKAKKLWAKRDINYL
jgi:anthranilate phosphoribosyltransferase